MHRAARLLFAAHLADGSGAVRAAAMDALGLARRGWPVAIVFPGESPFVDSIRAQGLEAFVYPNPAVGLAEAQTVAGFLALARARLRYFAMIRRAIRAWRAEAMIAHSMANLWAPLAARRERIPLCLAVHERYVESAAARLRKRIAQRLARAMLFCSESGREAFGALRAGMPAAVIENGVDESRFDFAEEKLARMAQGGGGPEVRLLAVSALARMKGLHDLIDAFQRIAVKRPEAALDIVGPDPPREAEYARELRRMAEQSPAGRRILFHGPSSAVERFHQQADLFVLPSLAEEQSLAVIEAMLAGTPAVATRVGDCPALLGEGERGWLAAPGDAAGLAAAIAAALESPAEAVARACAARAWALQRHSQSRRLDRLEAFLESWLGRR